MVKILMWPGILALVVLLLIVVFSKKGSVVSEAAKNAGPANHSYGYWFLGFGVLALAWMLFVLAGVRLRFNEYIWMAGWAGGLGILTAIAFGMFIHMAINFVLDFAAAAAELGEHLNVEAKRAVFQRGMRWFRKFRNS